MILTDSNLDYDSMRSLVIESIKNNEFNQYGDIKNHIVNKLISMNYVKETNSCSFGYSQAYNQLNSRDEDIVNQVVWDLIIERILTIGLNENSNSWPFLRLTEYGKKIIKETDDVIVYDIDGMLKKLKNNVPNVNPTIVRYFAECLNTYRINALLASSVMLGCAAEKGILLLFDSYLAWIERNFSTKESDNLKKIVNKNISKKFDELNKSLNGHRANINQDLFDDFDIFISSLFTIIRKNRNDAGHPTDKIIDKDELRSMIYVFINHCKKIYDFIEYFCTNKKEG